MKTFYKLQSILWMTVNLLLILILKNLFSRRHGAKWAHWTWVKKCFLIKPHFFCHFSQIPSSLLKDLLINLLDYVYLMFSKVSATSTVCLQYDACLSTLFWPLGWITVLYSVSLLRTIARFKVHCSCYLTPLPRRSFNLLTISLSHTYLPSIKSKTKQNNPYPLSF